MRDRDLELIAALVEGRLEDESEARALVESSPEARAEYEAQRRVHVALTGLDRAVMTESERSALHRDVWTALRGGPAGSQAKAVPWYGRWVPAAAALVALLVVGVVGILGGGEEAADFLETGADAERATTTAAAGATTAGDGEGMTPFDAPGTTAGATGSDEDGVSREAAQFYSAEAERVRAADGVTTAGDDSTEETDLDRCLRDAGLVDHVVVDSVEPEEIDATQTKRVLVAVPEGVEIEEAAVTFVDAASCEVVYTDE